MGSTGRGTSTQTQNQTQSSQTNPWGPTIGPLQSLISQISGQMGNYVPTAGETGAINTLRQNAAQPLDPRIAGLGNDLLNGGQDRTAYATNAYGNYQAQAQPYLSQDYLDPYKNPAFQKYLDTTASDITNRLSGMYASAGRDPAGAGGFAQELARGITQGTAPIFANQYNQNVATQRGAMDSLYSAGTNTGNTLSLLDQTALNNRMGGASLLPQLEDMQANRMLSAEGTNRNLPLQNLGILANLLTPLAGLGGTSTGNMTGTTNSQYQLPLAQTFGLWTQGISNLFPKSAVKVG